MVADPATAAATVSDAGAPGVEIPVAANFTAVGAAAFAIADVAAAAAGSCADGP
ncbi:hypothetical protein NKH98_11335 [Mesorhizobium sp. M0833]|uniref:hypothetical protein n=1 Tax=Mesorhizobium sp. M0833 TaxID=2957009 RepID=UPI0033358BF1